MDLIADQDVQSVVEFIQRSVPATRLVSVANAVAGIAPLLWGHHKAEEVLPLQLVCPPISDGGRRTQSVASE